MVAAESTNNGPMCKETYKSISKHLLKNALLQRDLPLTDLIHGPYRGYRMMPPELLHTSGSGLIMWPKKVEHSSFSWEMLKLSS